MNGWWLASYLALWLLLLGTLLVLLVVLRQLGLLYLQIRGGGTPQLSEGPAVGSLLRFDELDIDAQPVHFPVSSSAFNILLCTTASCRICEDVLRALATVLSQADLGAVVIDAGSPVESRELRNLVDERVALVSSLALQRRIGVTATPYGIVTDGKGVVVSKGTVHHLDDVESLIDRARIPVEPLIA